MTETTPVAPPATAEDTRSFAHFLQMLEDGRLNADLSQALRDLNADMNDHAHVYGNKCKGTLTLKLEFALEKGIFEIKGNYDVKTPKVQRDRTIAWSTPGNNFTPQNPRQMHMFDKPRDVTSRDTTDIRTA